MKHRKGIIEINSERCKGCGLCVPVCPRGSIVISEEPNRAGYYPARFTPGACTGCGLCYTVCPEPGCIQIFIRAEKDK